jgi:Mg2+ and Co2+ transporter CorA
MDISQFVKPFGIITYSMIILTVLAGLWGRKINLKLKHHKALAFTAVILATVHVTLITLLGD